MSSIDVPNPDDPGARIQGSIGAFDISLADYVNGIPSRISASTKNLVFAIPQGEATEMARALGIETVDLGYDLKLHWDRDAGTIVVENVAIDGADLGTISISATLGNATEGLFSADNSVAEAALMGLTVKDLTVNLDDRGLSALVIGVAAASEKQDPTATRLGFSNIAQAIVLQFLGGTSEAAAAATGIGTFLTEKNQLSLRIVARDDGGLTMLDLMQAEKDPSVLAGKISVTATASGEARPADVAIELPDAPASPADDTSSTAPDAAAPDDDTQSGQQVEKESLKN